MSLEELIALCESKQESLEDYKEIRKLIGKEYDKLNKSDQRVLGEYLEFLELTIDMLEGEGVFESK